MNASFHAAVAAIYDAALDPAVWPEALQAIADCLGDVGALLLYGRDDGTFGYIESIGLTGIIERFFACYDGDDLRAARGVERGVFLSRSVVTDRHLVSAEEMKDHPFYAALRAFDLKYFATVPIWQDLGIVAGVAVQRSITRSAYGDDELETLRALGLHVERAFRLGVRLLNAELLNSSLGEALGRLNVGIFALDSLARVRFSNPAAERLLGDGVDIIDGRFRLRAAEASAAVRAAVNRSDGMDPRPILVSRARSDKPLTLYLLPVSRRASGQGAFPAQVRAIVLAVDRAAEDPPDPALVRDVLGLTLGEARLASLVGSGSSPSAAAAALGITDQSARTVLKRVFAKVGISRQSELSALMSRLLLR